MQRILVATDGTPAAAHAVALGVDLASTQGAAVTFVHVVPSSYAILPGMLGPSLLVAPPPAAEARAALDAAERLARDAGVEADVVVAHGEPADEIVAFADTIDADVIVVGTRQRHAVAGAFLGSVSRSVLHEARRPVLVARATVSHDPA